MEHFDSVDVIKVEGDVKLRRLALGAAQRLALSLRPLFRQSGKVGDEVRVSVCVSVLIVRAELLDADLATRRIVVSAMWRLAKIGRRFRDSARVGLLCARRRVEATAPDRNVASRMAETGPRVQFALPFRLEVAS